MWFERCPTCGKTFHADQRFDAEAALRAHMKDHEIGRQER